MLKYVYKYMCSSYACILHWQRSMAHQFITIIVDIFFLLLSHIYAFLSNCSHTLAHSPRTPTHAVRQAVKWGLTMRIRVSQIDICVNVADNDCYYIYCTLFYIFIEHNALLFSIGWGTYIFYRIRASTLRVCVYVVLIHRSIVPYNWGTSANTRTRNGLR